jgi:WXG100 family type VII secretion target
MGVPDAGPADTQLLETEAMQKMVTTFQDAVANYGAKLRQVQDRVANLVTDAWKGDKGPAAFQSLHNDWDRQITNIVAIIDDIGKKVGIQSAKFAQVDADAARAQSELNAAGFGG